jgi:hypothetical protein
MAGLALASSSLAPARASIVNFRLTGPDPAYSFKLDDAPVVDNFKLGFSFEIAGYTFYNAKAGGGFNQYYNNQLYSGPENDPTFTPGVFLLYNADTGNIDTLTVAWVLGSPPPAVPEPSTWAMMLLGFAGVGLSAYRRTKTASAAA